MYVRSYAIKNLSILIGIIYQNTDILSNIYFINNIYTHTYEYIYIYTHMHYIYVNIHIYIHNTIETLSCAIIRSSIVYISRGPVLYLC